MEITVHGKDGSENFISPDQQMREKLSSKLAGQGSSENPGDGTPEPKTTPPTDGEDTSPKGDDKQIQDDPNKNEDKSIDTDKGDDTSDKEKVFNKEDINKNFVPQARFNKIYGKMKQLEGEMSEMKASHTEKLKSLSDEDVEYRNDLKKQGFVPEDEKEIVAQQRELEKLNKEMVQEIESDIQVMEKEFDGKNGLPKFSKDNVIRHGLDNNIMNPKVAYKDLHFAEIVDFYVNESLQKIKKTPPTKFNDGGKDNKPDIGRPENAKLGSSAFKSYLTKRLQSFK